MSVAVFLPQRLVALGRNINPNGVTAAVGDIDVGSGVIEVVLRHRLPGAGRWECCSSAVANIDGRTRINGAGLYQGPLVGAAAVTAVDNQQVAQGCGGVAALNCTQPVGAVVEVPSTFVPPQEQV